MCIRDRDSAAAEAIDGVLDVVSLVSAEPPFGFQALGGVAVLATDTWSAIKGRDTLQIEWESGANSEYDSAKYREQLEATVAKPGAVVRKRGDDFDDAVESADAVHRADYYLPHLAHASMEPPAAVAITRADSCELWAPVQNPQAVQQAVGAALGLPRDKVTCHVTLLGGGFGRKSKPDFCVCLLYTSPSPRDRTRSRMPSSA